MAAAENAAARQQNRRMRVDYLLLRRKADVERLWLAGPDLDRRRVRPVAVLAHFDTMLARRKLDLIPSRVRDANKEIAELFNCYWRESS